MSQITTTNTAPTTSTRRRDRQPAKRPEQLAAEASIAATTAEAKPAVQLSDEQRARIEKEKAKLEKERKAAARREARLEALERGEEPASTKGLPPVVKMNELVAVAHHLHRSFVLLTSDAVAALTDGSDRGAAATVVADLRNAAMRKWQEQFAARVAAGAADNETIEQLRLIVEEETGKVTLLPKAKGEKEDAAE